MYSQRDRLLALCGIFQATHLVQQIARHGLVDQDVFENSIKSIFKVDAVSPEEVYDGAQNLLYGCKVLLVQLGANAGDSVLNKTQRDIEVTKYTINVIALEKKLRKRGDLVQIISKGIANATTQAEHFSLTHENVIANLADTYTKSISTLKPQIIVSGEQNHLSNPGNTNRIRALLLAAIRSAVLWHQCGGTRWQILLKRSLLIEQARALLRENKPVLH